MFRCSDFSREDPFLSIADFCHQLPLLDTKETTRYVHAALQFFTDMAYFDTKVDLPQGFQERFSKIDLPTLLGVQGLSRADKTRLVDNIKMVVGDKFSTKDISFSQYPEEPPAIQEAFTEPSSRFESANPIKSTNRFADRVAVLGKSEQDHLYCTIEHFFIQAATQNKTFTDEEEVLTRFAKKAIPFLVSFVPNRDSSTLSKHRLIAAIQSVTRCRFASLSQLDRVYPVQMVYRATVQTPQNRFLCWLRDSPKPELEIADPFSADDLAKGYQPYVPVELDGMNPLLARTLEWFQYSSKELDINDSLHRVSSAVELLSFAKRWKLKPLEKAIAGWLGKHAKSHPAQLVEAIAPLLIQEESYQAIRKAALDENFAPFEFYKFPFPMQEDVIIALLKLNTEASNSCNLGLTYISSNRALSGFFPFASDAHKNEINAIFLKRCQKLLNQHFASHEAEEEELKAAKARRRTFLQEISISIFEGTSLDLGVQLGLLDSSDINPLLVELDGKQGTVGSFFRETGHLEEIEKLIQDKRLKAKSNWKLLGPCWTAFGGVSAEIYPKERVEYQLLNSLLVKFLEAIEVTFDRLAFLSSRIVTPTLFLDPIPHFWGVLGETRRWLYLFITLKISPTQKKELLNLFNSPKVQGFFTELGSAHEIQARVDLLSTFTPMSAIAYWHSIAEENPIKGYMTSCLIEYTLAAFSEKTRTDAERSSETLAKKMIEDVLARRVPPIDQIPITWPLIIDTNWNEEAQDALDLFNKKDSIEYFDSISSLKGQAQAAQDYLVEFKRHYNLFTTLNDAKGNFHVDPNNEFRQKTLAAAISSLGKLVNTYQSTPKERVSSFLTLLLSNSYSEQIAMLTDKDHDALADFGNMRDAFMQSDPLLDGKKLRDSLHHSFIWIPLINQKSVHDFLAANGYNNIVYPLVRGIGVFGLGIEIQNFLTISLIERLSALAIEPDKERAQLLGKTKAFIDDFKHHPIPAADETSLDGFSTYFLAMSALIDKHFAGENIDRGCKELDNSEMLILYPQLMRRLEKQFVKHYFTRIVLLESKDNTQKSFIEDSLEAVMEANMETEEGKAAAFQKLDAIQLSLSQANAPTFWKWVGILVAELDKQEAEDLFNAHELGEIRLTLCKTLKALQEKNAAKNASWCVVA